MKILLCDWEREWIRQIALDLDAPYVSKSNVRCLLLYAEGKTLRTIGKQFRLCPERIRQKIVAARKGLEKMSRMYGITVNFGMKNCPVCRKPMW